MSQPGAGSPLPAPPSGEGPAPGAPPPHVWTTEKLLLIFSVVAPAVMQMLNGTTVNVAVAQMAGGLGTTTDNVSWVITSYMVSMSVFLPLTGYINDRLGRRRYLLICMGSFVAFSVLCGIAVNLEEMVVFRIFQGISAAAFTPLSRTVLVETFPRDQVGRATAVWGMGLAVAPIFGPTLGGWLTEAFSWRAVFYINVPISALAMLLALRYLPDTRVKDRSMDFAGLVSLTCGVGALQFLLDRGRQEDWFESDLIRAAAAVSFLGFCAFAIHALRPRAHPIFHLDIFKDRNFTLATLTMSATGIGMFGGNFLQPLFLANLMHYPALTVGLVLMARGMGSLAAMTFAGRLADRFRAKWVALPGVLLAVLGCWMMTRYTDQITPYDLLLPLFLQGMGTGLTFVPLTALAFFNVAHEKAAEAAGVYSLIRSVSGALGVSATSTFLAHSVQVQWLELRGYLNPFNPALQAYLEPLGLDAQGQGIAVLARALATQSQMTAYISSFWFLAASFAVMIPMVLALEESGRRGRRGAGAAGMAA